MDGNLKRIKVILKTPNPLFKEWLKELIDEATRKKRKISKTYQKALDSLEKYPITLHSGNDCAILDGFGPKICEILEEKLQQHLAKSNDRELKGLCFKDKLLELKKREQNELTEFIKDIEASHLTDESLNDKTSKSLKNNKTNLSIIEEEQDVEMKCDSSEDEEEQAVEAENEDNIEELEDLLSDKESDAEVDDDSFDRLVKKYCPKVEEQKKPKTQLKLPKPDISSPRMTIENKRLKKFKSFNAVSNVVGPAYASSPISKFLNVENNLIDSPKRPTNCDEFDKLVGSHHDIEVLPSPILPKKKVMRQEKIDQVLFKPPLRQPTTSVERNEEEKEKQDLYDYVSVDEINPLEYDVILSIDVGESKTVSNEIKSKLQEHGVKSDVRKLHVGDFLWIAKNKTNKKEYALPYIVERKRLDDLSSSIKDGRFHEQKFRLKQCGIENVIYLIENYTKGGKVQCGLPFPTLLQAAANTQIQSKFQVKFTENCDHTGLYLAVMSSFIENIFKNKKPFKYKLLEFETFNQSSVKQRKCTVRETFIKQLLSIKGLSVDIALEITKYYPTPSHLYSTYISSSKSEGEGLLSKITIGDLERKIPSTISKSVYHYYMHK